MAASWAAPVRDCGRVRRRRLRAHRLQAGIPRVRQGRRRLRLQPRVRSFVSEPAYSECDGGGYGRIVSKPAYTEYGGGGYCVSLLRRSFVSGPAYSECDGGGYGRFVSKPAYPEHSGGGYGFSLLRYSIVSEPTYSE